MSASPAFSRGELSRYSRHLILPEVGQEGQQKLKSAKVLIVGAGGLGCPSSLYLAAAGIGHIGVVDFDTVDISNLQRQVLYTTDDVGERKVNRAAARLLSLNNEIQITPHDEKICAANAKSIIAPYDIVIDGTDNFATRYLINDACVLLHKPNVYGSIYRFEGQLSLFYPPDGPCYRCLFPNAPPPDAVPNCAEGGVLGVLAGTIGALQATEAIKWILGKGETLQGRLMLYDALDMRFDCLAIKRNPHCPICGLSPTITDLVDETVVCAANFGAAESSETIRGQYEITPLQLQTLLAQGTQNVLLLDVRSPQEFALCRLPHATLIPLNELENRAASLDPAKEIIVYCKSGIRSSKGADILRSKGFTRVRPLHGGLLQWAADVDASMDVY